MGNAALFFGFAGAIVAIVPSLGTTQMLGVGLGVLAILCGNVWGSKIGQTPQRSRRHRMGSIVGVVAIVFSVIGFGVSHYVALRAVDSLQRKLTGAQPQLERELRRGLEEGLRRSLTQHQGAKDRRPVKRAEK